MDFKIILNGQNWKENRRVTISSLIAFGFLHLRTLWSCWTGRRCRGKGNTSRGIKLQSAVQCPQESTATPGKLHTTCLAEYAYCLNSRASTQKQTVSNKGLPLRLWQRCGRLRHPA